MYIYTIIKIGNYELVCTETKGSRKKSSLNGRAIKALPPPPRAEWP